MIAYVRYNKRQLEIFLRTIVYAQLISTVELCVASGGVNYLLLVCTDGLFGNCQKSGRLLPDVYRYHLSADQRQQLETILLALIESGYAWSHQYTQCVIANVLLAYRSRVQFDLGFCSASRSGPVTSARWSAAGHSDDDLVVPSWLSRDTFPPEVGTDERASLGTPESEDYRSTTERDGELALSGVEEFLRGLSSDDLDALERYVVDEERAGEPQEYEGAVRTLPDGDYSSSDDVGELMSVV